MLGRALTLGRRTSGRFFSPFPSLVKVPAGGGGAVVLGHPGDRPALGLGSNGLVRPAQTRTPCGEPAC